MAYGRPARPSFYSPTNRATGLNGSASGSIRTKVILLLVVTSMYTTFLYRSGGASSFFTTSRGSRANLLSIATWNIAAINNNPFEYWITYKENPAYEQLMVDIERFIEMDPSDDKNLKVDQVFTNDMMQALDKRLTKVGWASVQNYWDNDFSKRRIITEFLKDPLLGSKRLASMPDRITNTINLASGEQVFRPTVINMYEGDLGTLDKWWKEWEAFMFDKPLEIEGKSGKEKLIPYQMLQPISKAKYPDIEEQEEKDSLPLQTLCGAIFDAILVHMMNTVSKPNVWQPLKQTMVENLNKKKVPHTLEILEKQYMDSDIIALQEVSQSFIEQARRTVIGKRFHVLAPADLDSTRDQNSVVCLNKQTFPVGMMQEITPSVAAAFPQGVKVPVAPGDIFALETKHADGSSYIVASFHGDTNGLATKPVVEAILQAMKNNGMNDHKLIFGMDANTYEHATPGKQQDVLEFGESYVSLGLTSCWGDKPQPSNYTTYNARTFLQPQLNKACRQEEKREKGDVNPKDFILFKKNDFTVVETLKDNTGKKQYIEDMAFPTLNFPSDHGILSTTLEQKVAE
ncbi:hypothetical protein MPSEU_000459400 [Mayamaea pseudoterrestris]|nr:hypothetical protein MPSEU_000459400 [Mayamaea pseudoterrestris]